MKVGLVGCDGKELSIPRADVHFMKCKGYNAQFNDNAIEFLPSEQRHIIVGAIVFDDKNREIGRCMLDYPKRVNPGDKCCFKFGNLKLENYNGKKRS